MNINYLQSNPAALLICWETMEEMQDKHRYYWWGWGGFVPIVFWV